MVRFDKRLALLNIINNAAWGMDISEEELREVFNRVLESRKIKSLWSDSALESYNKIQNGLRKLKR